MANSELMEDSEGNGSECEEGGKPELEESNENEEISNVMYCSQHNLHGECG